MIGSPSDPCPYTNRPANECELGDEGIAPEHARWHVNQMVELGFAEIGSLDSDGEPIINLTYARIPKVKLYMLATEIAHEKVDLIKVINMLDKWREEDSS